LRHEWPVGPVPPGRCRRVSILAESNAAAAGEDAGSVALLIRRLRRLAGVMLAISAACVFPANIKHAVEGIHVPPLADSWWYHGRA
jgi:uncharacterized membrane protein